MIIDQLHELILEDRRISAKLIAEQLGISCERVGSIIHEDLDMLVRYVACFLPGWAKDLSAPLYFGLQRSFLSFPSSLESIGNEDRSCWNKIHYTGTSAGMR